ncbi:hypothetical protein DAPPUDRAFT_238988 [Daphnia pulex]|uniref:Uncharacterized protein n=1 Tax=Daphnia pulex TaxID=6669 RepID=E9G7Y1_DAPPU|nr:hypothetical protein DAPPUDRAFT_238988 [Daphnia pulex]|eukprot:EFX84581.1 hypothetical protein DAPPUDRAFT_238988 [Daphnia pulex]
MTKKTLQAVLSMGLDDDELEDHEVIIQQLRDRCNAGRNRHVWRQQFAMKKQRANESADNWLCELRELASKCEFLKDCCSKCQPTRILGQIVFGVYDDDVRRKLLERGDTVATRSFRTAERSLWENGKTTALTGQTSNVSPSAISAGPFRCFRRLIISKK